MVKVRRKMDNYSVCFYPTRYGQWHVTVWFYLGSEVSYDSHFNMESEVVKPFILAMIGSASSVDLHAHVELYFCGDADPNINVQEVLAQVDSLEEKHHPE